MILPPYTKEKFVDRHGEVGLVTDAVRQLQNPGGKQQGPKAIVFRGERGLGKTWLAFHLNRTALNDLKAVTLYLAFYPLPREYRDDLRENECIVVQDSSTENTCLELMKWVCQKLGIAAPRDASLVEARRALIGGVQPIFTQSKVLVIILDAVYEAAWEFVEAVEENFLAPLADLPNTLFVMTGRGRPYPFVSPIFRTRLVECTVEELPKQNLEDLMRAYPPVSDLDSERLTALGGGSPLVGYLLLQAHDPVQELDSIVDYLLGAAPPELNRQRLRESFEALSVLEVFRENEMDVIVKEYYRIKSNRPTRPLEALPVPVRQLRDELLKTNLFYWVDDGFRIDGSLRIVLNNYLKRNQNGLWLGLNCAAYRIYSGYAEKYPRYQSDYEALALPYKNILESARAWEACAAALPKEAQA